MIYGQYSKQKAYQLRVICKKNLPNFVLKNKEWKAGRHLMKINFKNMNNNENSFNISRFMNQKLTSLTPNIL